MFRSRAVANLIFSPEIAYSPSFVRSRFRVTIRYKYQEQGHFTELQTPHDKYLSANIWCFFLAKKDIKCTWLIMVARTNIYFSIFLIYICKIIFYIDKKILYKGFGSGFVSDLLRLFWSDSGPDPVFKNWSDPGLVLTSKIPPSIKN